MATEPTPIRDDGGYWRTRWKGDRINPKTGKPKWYTESFGSVKTVKKSDAKRAFNNWLVDWKTDERVREPMPDERDWTIQRLADEHAKHAETYYRKPDGTPTGGADAIALAFSRVVGLYPKLPAKDFRPSMLRKVQRSMIDDGLARSTINDRIVKIRSVFKWAVSHERVPASVLTGLQAVPALKRGRSAAKEPEPVRPVARGVVNATLAELPGPLRAMIELQWLTGMRSSEVCIMRPRDINTSGEVWIYSPPSHKTEHHGREKRIPLGPKAQAIIEPYRRTRTPDAYLFDPREALRERHATAKTHRRPNQKPNPRETERTVRGHYDKYSYRRAIDRAIAAARGRGVWIPSWSPHKLRHSAGTRLRQSYGIEAARLVLGHTSAATTEIYAEIDHTAAVRIMAEAG